MVTMIFNKINAKKQASPNIRNSHINAKIKHLKCRYVGNKNF